MGEDTFPQADPKPFRTPWVPLLLGFFLLGIAEMRGQEEDPNAEYSYTLGIAEREHLGSGPNTEWPELLPRINADGTRLYFIRKHAPGNTGGVDDQDDIYYSDLKSDGTWGEGVNIGPPLNTTGSDVLFWISPDETTALLYHGREVDGAERGLSIARKRGNTWSEPEPISIDGVESLGNWYYASLTADRKHLLLAYRKSGDEFNLDLFHAPALSDDLLRWGTPVEFNGINSPFIDGSPWLSSDGRSLYFVSDRPNGMGLGDVYVSRRVADDWRYWSRPEMIGSSVNSPGFEADVSLSADGGWLYTGRVDFNEPQSEGRADLYRNRLPDTIRSNITITSVGRLIDAATGKGISGEVQFILQKENLDLGKVRTTAEGDFSILIMPGAIYKVIGSAPGYQSGGIVFDTRRTKTTDPPKHIQVSLQKGSTSTETDRLTDIRILFATGSDRLDRSARADLRRFVSAWRTGGSPAVTLLGFTDTVGTESANIGLAQRRAEAVAVELRNLGIPADRISVQARGEAPGAGADAGSPRLNRRVDLRVE